MIEEIPLGWVRRHAAGAVRQGLDLDDLLAASMIEVRHGDDRDTVTPAQYLLLCMNTTLGVDDAAHGLATSSLGPLYPAIGLRMALGCQNLGAAINALIRLYSLASSAIAMELRVDGDAAILRVHSEGRNDQDMAQLEETYLGWIYMNLIYVLGRPFPVGEVVVRDPAHFNLGRLHWAMGGLVSYGGCAAIRFSRRLLEEPLATRDGAVPMWECQRLLLSSLAADRADDPVARYVANGDFVHFSDMVRTSGRSASTMRRQLQAHTGGFRQSRRRALAEAAIERLRASDDSVGNVAVELGYSDDRSFRRFLKGATGLTPQQVRAQPCGGDWQAETRALDRLRQLANGMSI